MATHPVRDLIDNARLRAADGARADEPDAHLLTAFIDRRDEAAFAALVRRHGGMVWGVCRRLVGHHDAEDAFQATFLVLARKAGSVRPRANVAAWLHGVAYRAACKLRTSYHRRREETGLAAEPSAAEAVADDLRPLLDRELARLPDRHRAAVLLCDLEGLTRQQAAARLGVPEGTVAGWQARGRARLAAQLARRGVAPAVALAPAAAGRAEVPTAIGLNAVRSAVPHATGEAVAVSPQVASLAAGVSRAMLFPQLKLALAAAVVCAAGLTAAAFSHQDEAAAGGEPGPQPADPPRTAAAPTARTEKQVMMFETVVKRNDGGPKKTAEVVVRSEKEWKAFVETVSPEGLRDELLRQKFDFDREVVVAVARGASQSVATREDGINRVRLDGDKAVVEWTEVESDHREGESKYPVHVIKMPKVKDVTFKKTRKVAWG